MPLIHPGRFLDEILEELNLSQALLFGRAFGQFPQYWLNLQSAYDLKKTEIVIAEQLKVVPELSGVSS